MGSPNFSDLGGSSISFLRAGSCGSVATGRKFGYHGADGLGARRSVRILPNAEGEWAKSTIAARIPVIANSIYNSARERGDKWLSHAPVFHFLSILLFFGVGHCEQVGGAWSASVSLGAVGVLHIWRGHWRELPTRSESCRAGRRFHPFRIGFAHSISPPPLLTRLGGLRRGRLSRGARRRPSRHLSFLEHWAIAIYIRSTLPR